MDDERQTTNEDHDDLDDHDGHYVRDVRDVRDESSWLSAKVFRPGITPGGRLPVLPTPIELTARAQAGRLSTPSWAAAAFAARGGICLGRAHGGCLPGDRGRPARRNRLAPRRPRSSADLLVRAADALAGAAPQALPLGMHVAVARRSAAPRLGSAAWWRAMAGCSGAPQRAGSCAEFEVFMRELTSRMQIDNRAASMEVCTDTFAASGVVRCHLDWYHKHEQNIFVGQAKQVLFRNSTPPPHPTTNALASSAQQVS